LQQTSDIAIGPTAASSNQHANRIVLNAYSTGPVWTTMTEGLFANPVRQNGATGSTGPTVMLYDSTAHEILFDGAKTFVIDHPTQADRLLVHACLEGPEASVYYRGEADLVDQNLEIELPAYVDAPGYDALNSLEPILSHMNVRRNGRNPAN
jgi:hypothetical protein